MLLNHQTWQSMLTWWLVMTDVTKKELNYVKFDFAHVESVLYRHHRHDGNDDKKRDEECHKNAQRNQEQQKWSWMSVSMCNCVAWSGIWCIALVCPSLYITTSRLKGSVCFIQVCVCVLLQHILKKTKANLSVHMELLQHALSFIIVRYSWVQCRWT